MYVIFSRIKAKQTYYEVSNLNRGNFTEKNAKNLKWLQAYRENIDKGLHLILIDMCYIKFFRPEK